MSTSFANWLGGGVSIRVKEWGKVKPKDGKALPKAKVDGSWRVALANHSKTSFRRLYGMGDFARAKPTGGNAYITNR